MFISLCIKFEIIQTSFNKHSLLCTLSHLFSPWESFFSIYFFWLLNFCNRFFIYLNGRAAFRCCCRCCLKFVFDFRCLICLTSLFFCIVCIICTRCNALSKDVAVVYLVSCPVKGFFKNHKTETLETLRKESLQWALSKATPLPSNSYIAEGANVQHLPVMEVLCHQHRKAMECGRLDAWVVDSIETESCDCCSMQTNPVPAQQTQD